MNIPNLLKKYDLFSKLSSNALENLSVKAVYKKLDAKEMIFTEGFEGSFFYMLLSGSVRIFKTSYDGKESTIKIIHPGEIFAEAALFQKKNYPASAVTVEKSEVIAIHRKSFFEMIRDQNSNYVFIEAVFGKLRFLTDQIHYLSSHDVEDRFFRFLISTYGKKYRYNISLAKKEIASAIGTIPETFSRLILRLTKMGIIAWKKNSLIIKDGFWDNDYFNE
ncbi:MAG: Crp/Fnr family transcriptional regulator [Spirochaetes bacterium]|nr:Crp/Fnr family transcriptional regulator [Spirochaetota bacterium]